MIDCGRSREAALIALATWTLAASAQAEVVHITPADNLQDAVDGLGPGDELVLAGGTYTLTYRFSIGVSGTQQQPIVIRSAAGETAIIDRDSSQNTINVEGAQYVELRNLEVMHGSHGIRMDGASFITIEGCHVHDTADVAISANVGGNDYEGLRIVGNHIHDTGGTGEGMYLGCNSDGCRIFDSLIAGNYIHHTDTGVSQGDGIEIKEGSHDNVVRDNVIHDTNYPCILTYSAVGNGGPNIIERNVMWNCGDHAIQSAEDSVIRNNIILSAAASGIALQPHQAGVPGNQEILHNTVLSPGSGVAVRVSGLAGTLLIANNAIYSEGGTALQVGGDTSGLTVTGNVGSGATTGFSGGFDAGGDLATDFVSASYAGGPPIDVFPAAGSALIAAGDAGHVAADDFNGTDRGGVADVGAYKYDAAGNPGWTIQEGLKDDIAGGTGGNGTGGAGTGGTGVGATGGAGGTGATGAAGTTPTGDLGDDSGCGCRTAPLGAAQHGLAGLALLGVVALLRRRRRR